MKRHALTVLTLIVFLALAPVALAEQGSGGPGGPPKGAPAEMSASMGQHPGGPHGVDRMEMMHKKLGVTDEQKKAMRQMYAGFRDKTRKARMELASLKDEKKTMLIAAKVDQKKLAQIDDQIVKLVSEVLTERLKVKRDWLAMLTPEQVDRLAGLVAKKTFWKEMRKRHHKGRDEGF
ncbi:MAG: periplasmic heavy metal sensor [Desulfomonile tiedjei]|nr:periplasmic heavy metal sensor [Desulfomonile tiedjei]